MSRELAITIGAVVFGLMALVVAIWLYINWPAGGSVVATPIN